MAPPPVDSEDCASGALDIAASEGSDPSTSWGDRFIERGEEALRTHDRTTARVCFDAALRVTPSSPAALYGLGVVAAAEGDQQAAMTMFGRATAADPGMAKAWIALRIAELHRVEEILASSAEPVRSAGPAEGSSPHSQPGVIPVAGSRSARPASRPVAAAGSTRAVPVDAFRAAIRLAPRVLPPYLWLADDLGRAGDAAAAVDVLERGHRYIGDTPALLQALSSAYLVAGDTAGAVATAGRLVEVAPDDAAARDLLERARRRHERATLPASFSEMGSRPEIVREDLAGLLATRLPDDALVPRSEMRSRPPTDVGDSWAAEHIRRVTAAGVMEVFPNHSFAPELIVTRGMLADVLYRALQRGGGAPGPAPDVRITDVPRQHLGYDAIRSVVGNGIMALDGRGRFGVLEPASGAEVVDAVERLRVLLQ